MRYRSHRSHRRGGRSRYHRGGRSGLRRGRGRRRGGRLLRIGYRM